LVFGRLEYRHGHSLNGDLIDKAHYPSGQRRK
jgi:hypothetical protein